MAPSKVSYPNHRHKSSTMSWKTTSIATISRRLTISSRLMETVQIWKLSGVSIIIRLRLTTQYKSRNLGLRLQILVRILHSLFRSRIFRKKSKRNRKKVLIQILTIQAPNHPNLLHHLPLLTFKANILEFNNFKDNSRKKIQ